MNDRLSNDWSDSSLERSAIRKMILRLVPLLLLTYFANCIDRSNISIAALTMDTDLKMTPAEFGFGAGIFFAGYLIFEVPIALITQRVGGRRAIGVMMLLWGVMSAATGYVTNQPQFYAVRLLLGIAEAGFFPALLMYLSCWFPAAYRARIIGMTMLALPLSSVIGAPLSTYFLVHYHGLLGLEGWRWLFIMEGIPASILGVLCIVYLSDHPRQAKWLSISESGSIERVLAAEREHAESSGHYSVGQALRSTTVILLALIMFLLVAALYGSVFWIPQLLKAMHFSSMEVGFLISIPYAVASLAMYYWAKHSDEKREKTWHLIVASAIGAIGFVLTGMFISSPLMAVIGLSLACAGIYAGLPILWTLPLSFLTGPAVAGALALITTVANSSGIVVPPLIGWSRQATGGFSAAMYGLAAIMLVAIFLILIVRGRRTEETRKANAMA